LIIDSLTKQLGILIFIIVSLFSPIKEMDKWLFMYIIFTTLFYH